MSSRDLTGQTVAQYHLHELIGKGGFGSIFKATNTVDQSVVAVKTLHAHMLEDEDVVERFQREARSLESLQHPNIVQLIDFSWDDKVGHFMVLEWLPGRSLKEHLREHKRLPPYELFGLFEQLLAGLGDAHAQGIVHRDLKPANLFLVPQGGGIPRLKILDFGLALLSFEMMRRTQKGAVMGSSNYMAPEQAMGKITEIDVTTDLFACGCLLSKCLTGRTPFRGNAYEIAMMHYEEKPIPTLAQLWPHGNYSPALEALHMRALARPKAERFASPWEFYQALQDAFGPELEAAPTEANLLQTFVASDPEALMAQLGHPGTDPRSLGFAPTPDELPQADSQNSALEFDLDSGLNSQSSGHHQDDVMSFSYQSGHSQSGHSSSGHQSQSQSASSNSFAADAFAETNMFDEEAGASMLEQFVAANQPRPGGSANQGGGVPFTAAVASAHTVLAPNNHGKGRKSSAEFSQPPSQRSQKAGFRAPAAAPRAPATAPVTSPSGASSSALDKLRDEVDSESSSSSISLMRRKPETSDSSSNLQGQPRRPPIRHEGVRMRGARIKPQRKKIPAAVLAGGAAFLIGVIVFAIFVLSAGK